MQIDLGQDDGNEKVVKQKKKQYVDVKTSKTAVKQAALIAADQKDQEMDEAQ